MMKWPLLALILSVGLNHPIAFGQILTKIAPGSEPFGIVDCFGQGNIHAARVRGVIVDPTGFPVPHALIRLSTEGGAERFSARTDASGRFAIRAPGGSYILRVDIEPFAGPEVGLELGIDAVNSLRTHDLNILLGLPGSFCPYVTTSAKKFNRAIESNKRELEEHTKKNATKK